MMNQSHLDDIKIPSITMVPGPQNQQCLKVLNVANIGIYEPCWCNNTRTLFPRGSLGFVLILGTLAFGTLRHQWLRSLSQEPENSWSPLWQPLILFHVHDHMFLAIFEKKERVSEHVRGGGFRTLNA
jgi:hypothetical protein